MARSQQAEWLESQPLGTFFRPRDVPGPSRDAVRAFLHRESSKPELERRAWRVAPAFYWRPQPPVKRSTGPKILRPPLDIVGRAYAGPGAAAHGWYGANYVHWSTQVAARHTYAVPGRPRLRNPIPGLRLLGRRNLARRELTFLEATYLEAAIGFDRWVETDWESEDPWAEIALTEADRFIAWRRAEGHDVPRADVFEHVAALERPPRGDLRTFRERVDRLVAVFRAALAR